MLFILGLADEFLQMPGQIYNYTCSGDGSSLDPITIPHKYRQYLFSVAVESLDGARVSGTLKSPNNRAKNVIVGTTITYSDE